MVEDRLCLLETKELLDNAIKNEDYSTSDFLENALTIFLKGQFVGKQVKFKM